MYQKINKNEKIAIWGAGDVGKGIVNILLELGYSLKFFIDSDSKKEGDNYLDIIIISPDSFIKELPDVNAVIIGVESPNAEKQIKKQLENIIIETKSELLIYSCLEARDYLCKEYIRKLRNVGADKWDVNFNSYVTNWVNNIDSEIRYWAKTFSSTELPEGYRNKMANKAFSGFDENIRTLENNLSKDAVVVDLGCGLATMYGHHAKNGEVKLIPMDPLAAFYNKMNLDNFDRKLDEEKVVRFGLFEFVDSFLDEEYADLIIINNALDHCIDPYRSIIKCLKVLKVGGVLRLYHRRAEAVYEGWMGLHKWNVDYNDSDEFILWNKDNCINISQKLADFANVRVVHSDYETDAWETFITVEIEKRDEACIDEFEYEQDAKELAFLLDLLMKKYADSYLEHIQ